MTITLTPGQEKMLCRHLKSGKFKSAGEVIDHALVALEEADSARETQRIPKSRFTIGGISLQDLVNEGFSAKPKSRAAAASTGIFALVARRQQA